MDIQVFRSFVKTALSLQVDARNQTPPGYQETKAAVRNRYPDLDREEERPSKTVNDPEQVKLAFGLRELAITTGIIAGMSAVGIPMFMKRYGKPKEASVVKLAGPARKFVDAVGNGRAFPGLVGAGVGAGVGNMAGERIFDKHDHHKHQKKGLLALGLAATGAAAGEGLRRLGGPHIRVSVKKASDGRHLVELGGLGTLAAPSIQELRHKPMSEKAKAGLEVAGLGALAAPYAHDLAMKSRRYAGSSVGRGLTKALGNGL